MIAAAALLTIPRCALGDSYLFVYLCECVHPSGYLPACRYLLMQTCSDAKRRAQASTEMSNVQIEIKMPSDMGVRRSQGLVHTQTRARAHTHTHTQACQDKNTDGAGGDTRVGALTYAIPAAPDVPIWMGTGACGWVCAYEYTRARPHCTLMRRIWFSARVRPHPSKLFPTPAPPLSFMTYMRIQCIVGSAPGRAHGRFHASPKNCTNAKPAIWFARYCLCLRILAAPDCWTPPA